MDSRTDLNILRPVRGGNTVPKPLFPHNPTNNVWTDWSSPAFVGLLQQMADGAAEPSFKVAPNGQTGWPDEPTHVQVEVVVDVDLDCPPL